jgi:hypothetical protein
MSKPIKVVFSTEDGITVERTLKAHWEPALATELAEYHTSTVIEDFKDVMCEIFAQSTDSEFFRSVIDELVSKAMKKSAEET